VDGNAILQVGSNIRREFNKEEVSK